MAVLGRFKKEPEDVLDYMFDYTQWLANRSDTIASVVVAPSSADLTIGSVTFLGGVVRAFVSGGVDGTQYRVKSTITTAGGRKKSAEIQLSVKEL